MSAFFVISFFLLGAIVASFMGVVAARLSTGQSFLTGHSRCDACGAPLSPFALIPILSYLVARGRAQCCGARISSIAPLSELLLGCLFALAYVRLGLTLALALMLIALALLLALVLYDLAHQILPSSLLYPFVVVSAVTGYLSAASTRDFIGVLLVALLIAGSLALLHIFSRGRAMGLADAPLALALALLTGSAALTGFVFSFWVGAVVGIVLLAKRPVGSRIGVEVPFAPFLACGFLLAYFTQWNLFTYISTFTALALR
jgi:leader peptidase (prepilin peptidase) / N-methyltransferase